MTATDYLVLAIYFAMVIAVGSLAGRRSRTSLAYFLGDRNIHWIPAGITMTAVSISTITFIGMPGQAFQSDWTFLQLYLAIPAASWLVCRFFLRRFVALQVETAYEYLERRFDTRTRLWAGAVFLLIICGSTGVVLYAPAILLAEMSGASIPSAILVLGIATAIYTVVGGVKGVIYTDIIQAIVFVGGWLFAFLFLLDVIPGGLTRALAVASEHGKLHTVETSLSAPVNIWSSLFGMLFTHVALSGVNQAQVQKYLTVSGISGGRKAILFHGFFLLALYVCFFALGTLLYVFYSGQAGRIPAGISSDRVFPMFILREMPAGVRGFLIAGAFAAAMSTLSSSLNSLANVTLADFLHSEAGKGFVRRARILTCVWTVVVIGAALLAWQLGSILEVIVRVNSYFYGCLLGVFLLGMFTVRASPRGARAGLCASMLAIVALALLQPDLWPWFGLAGCAISFLVGYYTSPERREELEPVPERI